MKLVSLSLKMRRGLPRLAIKLLDSPRNESVDKQYAIFLHTALTVKHVNTH